MKKIFWMFVAAMAWTGCSDDNGAEAPVPSDTLELSAETLAFDADGSVLEGGNEVTVTSSGEWRLGGRQPEKIYLKENIQKLYEKVESELSPREKLVLKMRYGLYNGEQYTQREIARQIGISRSYVSRIEKSAVEKLRAFFT